MTNNIYKQSRFMLGVNDSEQLPEDSGKEVAFAGRSNVGKSSVLNVISANQRLARTSKTPGRTQQLNYFEFDQQKRLVDLPGYGYARVPAQVQRHWSKLLEDYFQKRQSLVGLILIMDIRHPLKPFDEQMLAWCDAVRLPVHILLNKADKLSRGAAQNQLLQISKKIGNKGAGLQLFSAHKREGVNEARQVLDEWFEI